MSEPALSELLSEDPVERAIARKVVRILNDRTLDRAQRESLVRKAQHELIVRRKQKEADRLLVDQALALALPPGCKAQAVMVQAGTVQVGIVTRGKSFVWVEAGDAPAGAGWRQRALAVSQRANAKGAGPKNGRSGAQQGEFS